MKHQLNIQAETPVPFSDVPSLLPKRKGKKVHYCTVYRWATRGVRGRILDSQLVGGVRYTTITALNQFLGANSVKVTEDLEADAIEQALYGKKAS